MTKKRVFLCGTAMVVATVAVLAVAQRLLEPKYMSEVVEGNLIADYYQSAFDHDVVFIGDCEVYENFSPVALWEEYGISSCIRGSAQQLIWQSYYLLEDTLRYETPKAVVFNVLSMKYATPQNEAYNRMSLDGMRWSSSKVDAISASMTEEEDFLSYVFPILRYHSRWSELSTEDFRYFFGAKPNFFSGYYLRADVKPADGAPQGRPLTDYNFGDVCWDYLDRMRTLCAENGIALILVKAPSLYPYWYDEWDAQITAYAAEQHLPYYNFLSDDLQTAVGLDYQTDTYDGGLHLNVFGAEKLSHWFGQTLTAADASFGVTDRRGDPALAAEWSAIAARYDAERNLQLANLAAYGSIHAPMDSDAS